MKPVDGVGKRKFRKTQSNNEKTNFIYLNTCFLGGEALISALITHSLRVIS